MTIKKSEIIDWLGTALLSLTITVLGKLCEKSSANDNVFKRRFSHRQLVLVHILGISIQEGF